MPQLDDDASAIDSEYKLKTRAAAITALADFKIPRPDAGRVHSNEDFIGMAARGSRVRRLKIGDPV